MQRVLAAGALGPRAAAGGAAWLAAAGPRMPPLLPPLRPLPQLRGLYMVVAASAAAGMHPTAPRGAPSQQRRGASGRGPRRRPTRQDRREAAAARPAPLREQQQRRSGAPVRDDYFYAEAAASFEALGLSFPVAEAMRRAGFARPSRVQVRRAAAASATARARTSAPHSTAPPCLHKHLAAAETLPRRCACSADPDAE
jgi:hypothetical protein